MKPRADGWWDLPIVPPPSSFTVESERKPVLYLSDGTPMVKRPVGFNTGGAK